MPHDNAPPRLNCLTLDQLRDLSIGLSVLADAGDDLLNAGFPPVFDLTPGLPVSIHLDMIMPADPRIEDRDLWSALVGNDPEPEPARPKQTPPEAWLGGDSGGGAAGSDASLAAPGTITSGAIDHPRHLIPPHALWVGRDDGQPFDPELSVASGVARPESARQDAQEQPDGAVAPAPVGSPLDVATPDAAGPDPVTPGSTRALAQTAQGPRWTEEEDARAVQMAVEMLQRQHYSVDQMAKEIGPALGRPVPGTAFRLRQKLSNRITAALHTAMDADRTAKAAAARAAKAAAAKPDPQACVPPAAPRPASPAPLTPLGRHIANLPVNRDWTRSQDIALLEQLAKGFTVAEVCVDLGLQFPGVKQRTQELTQWDPVLKRANFTAADVLAALTTD